MQEGGAERGTEERARQTPVMSQIRTGASSSPWPGEAGWQRRPILAMLSSPANLGSLEWGSWYQQQQKVKGWQGQPLGAPRRNLKEGQARTRTGRIWESRHHGQETPTSVVTCRWACNACHLTCMS